MSYPIRKDLIKGLPQAPFRNGIGKWEGIVNHSTATPEASAEREQTFEENNWKSAFVHYFVDWTEIVQCADINYKGWGAGSVANARFLHIELCETKDENKFKESYARYVWLTVYLLRTKGFKVEDEKTVWSHSSVSKVLKNTNHMDPIDYLQSHGISWNQHIQNLKDEYAKQSQPIAPVKQKFVRVIYKGKDGLNVRKDSSTDSKVVAIAHENEVFTVIGEQNGFYKLKSGLYISSNPKYTQTFLK